MYYFFVKDKNNKLKTILNADRIGAVLEYRDNNNIEIIEWLEFRQLVKMYEYINRNNFFYGEIEQYINNFENDFKNEDIVSFIIMREK